MLTLNHSPALMHVGVRLKNQGVINSNNSTIFAAGTLSSLPQFKYKIFLQSVVSDLVSNLNHHETPQGRPVLHNMCAS